MRNNNEKRKLGVVIGFLLLSLISIGIIGTYPYILKNKNYLMESTESYRKDQEQQKKIDEYNYVIWNLYKGNYCIYVDMLRSMLDTNVEVSDVLLISDNEKSSDQNKDDTEGVENRENAEQIESIAQLENTYGLQYYEEYVEELNEVIDSWRDDFYYNNINEYKLDYYIIDNETGAIFANSADGIEEYVSASEEEIAKKYTSYMVLNYDSVGNFFVSKFYGMEQDNLDYLLTLGQDRNFLINQLDHADYEFSKQINSLINVTIIYGTSSILYEAKNYYNYGSELQAFSVAGYDMVWVIVLVIVAMLGLFLPFIKPFGIGKGLTSKIPFEFVFIVLGILIAFSEERGYAQMAYETATGNFLFDPEEHWLSEATISMIDYVFNYFAWMFVLSAWYIAVLSVRQVFVKGIKKYFKEQTVFGRIGTYLYKWVKGFVQSITQLDLKDNMNKNIIKLLFLNFIAVGLMCLSWFYGLIILIIYTILLYKKIKKNVNQVSRNYQMLLKLTDEMSEGNLNVKFEEDFGVFHSLKENLGKIQNGFKKAVEQEIKSEKMKTELITNVSHDLKTPLTGIITYVNLLKEENVSEEDRLLYIETIDHKSQRLKVLIEDLFEVSRASSKNVTLNYVSLDIVALIKQVELELSEQISSAHIDFRYQIENEKIYLNLDSDKTYRIFENLFTNIIKYGMSNTRAYIEVLEHEKNVLITLKNISATELTVSTEEISERFVRGDKSRNTEGTGLGLAIVKSFVELQGGRFRVFVDGDLFKIELMWIKSDHMNIS